jgi:glycosyltransferase involved in cell wall biosynthesis
MTVSLPVAESSIGDDKRQDPQVSTGSRAPSRHFAPPRHSLTIVIPALNEEESIGDIIRRCLEGREHIRQAAHVGVIEIVVVSDGSTDRTAEIAQEVARHEPTVSVIVFPQNRGYGAAIKAGFERGSGDLVAFLDADGTCDPRYFGPMCRAIDDENAAIVLGSRMGAKSQMPRIRRIGNSLFAFLLGAFSGRAVEDTASGMRVIRRDALSLLYPLPDGLNFTPAMSARAMMNDVPVIELPMDYAERVGRSKLSVLRDGMRFLRSIIDALLLYRPGRLFTFAAAVSLFVAIGWGLYPLEFYFQNRRLEEWMIYRILLSGFLVTCSVSLLAAAAFADRLLFLVQQKRSRSFMSQVRGRLFAPRALLTFAILSTIVAIVLVWPGLVEYVATRQVTLHWSRVVAAVFLLQVATTALIHLVLERVVALWRQQLRDYEPNA